MATFTMPANACRAVLSPVIQNACTLLCASTCAAWKTSLVLVIATSSSVIPRLRNSSRATLTTFREFASELLYSVPTDRTPGTSC